MSLSTRIVAEVLRLPPTRTHRIASSRDLRVPMRDGAVLLADRWYPVDAPTAPIILMRSPYGRAGVVSVFARLFAERGYQAVTQSCRGTHGSGGSFVPFRDEPADGEDTYRWLETQAWYGGAVGTWGGSYVGLTQWASSGSAPPSVRAMATSVTASRAGEAVVYPGGALALESVLGWAVGNSLPPARGVVELARRLRRMSARLPAALDVLPLAQGPDAVIGRDVGFYRDWLEHDDVSDEWWGMSDYSANVPVTTAAVTTVAGWYDMFLPYQLRDFMTLQEAGRHPRILIGAWTHGSFGMWGPMFRDALEWFGHHLQGRPLRRRKPIVVQLVGSRRWVGLETWPPPAEEAVWHLHGGGRLAPEAPGESQPDCWRYDPADPTPGVGGPSLAARNSGPADQSARRARPDVVSYTSDPFPADRTFIGPLSAHLHVTSSTPHFDLHVTLCDVAPSGTATNVSSGIVRCRDRRTDGADAVVVEMWPVGVTIAAGHRIAVDVAGGAHPTYNRNLGTGEPLVSATRMVVSERQLFHDPARPSRLVMREVSL